MLILLWVVIGFVSGFLVSKQISKTRQSSLVHCMLGIFGAVAGGWLYCFAALSPGVTVINLFSMFIAVAGAAVLLVIYEMLVHDDL
jgi:uncharacterized membrane protein YeaQ/YmgE (transglycosylase-associated protein family)